MTVYHTGAGSGVATLPAESFDELPLSFKQTDTGFQVSLADLQLEFEEDADELTVRLNPGSSGNPASEAQTFKVSLKGNTTSAQLAMMMGIDEQIATLAEKVRLAANDRADQAKAAEQKNKKARQLADFLSIFLKIFAFAVAAVMAVVSGGAALPVLMALMAAMALISDKADPVKWITQALTEFLKLFMGKEDAEKIANYVAGALAIALAVVEPQTLVLSAPLVGKMVGQALKDAGVDKKVAQWVEFAVTLIVGLVGGYAAAKSAASEAGHASAAGKSAGSAAATETVEAGSNAGKATGEVTNAATKAVTDTATKAATKAATEGATKTAGKAGAREVSAVESTASEEAEAAAKEAASLKKLELLRRICAGVQGGASVVDGISTLQLALLRRELLLLKARLEDTKKERKEDEDELKSKLKTKGEAADGVAHSVESTYTASNAILV